MENGKFIAARFFLLAEQASHLGWYASLLFWDMSASSAREAVAHLPALAAAVRKEHDSYILQILSLHPLPGVLPSEAVPWFDKLVEAWEIHRASSSVQNQNLALRALVRLDGCRPPDGQERPSRLPEWLAEARRMANGKWRKWRTRELKALAELAAWRPAPGVATNPETLREWVAFWQEVRRSSSPLIKGIAAKALLNLREADLRAASIQPYGQVLNPSQLLGDLAAAIPAAAKRMSQSWYYEEHLLLLGWQPVEGNTWPAAGMARVARDWLKVTSHNDWRCRKLAWQQLIRWDRAGSLAFCGMDLLPCLERAAQTESYGNALWEMARWTPVAEAFTGTEKADRLALLREWEAHWQRHRQSGDWLVRASAWVAGTGLHRAGLATESPESFLEAYLSAVARETDRDVLFVLVQWGPGAEAPAAFHREWQQGWQRRLVDEDESIRRVAVFVLLRQALEGTGDGAGVLRVLRAMMHRFPDEPTARKPVWPDIFARARDMWEQHWEDETGKVSGTCPAGNLSELESRFHRLHFPVLQQTSGNSPLPANINSLTQMGQVGN